MPPKKKEEAPPPEPAAAIAPETEPLSPELAEHYYTPQQILRILNGIHPDTLARWRVRGIGPPQTVLPGRQIVFSKASFFQWMKDREQQPRPRRALRRR
jgi:hypothetical protein